MTGDQWKSLNVWLFVISMQLNLILYGITRLE